VVEPDVIVVVKGLIVVVSEVEVVVKVDVPDVVVV
jgi:hypothetical protein